MHKVLIGICSGLGLLAFTWPLYLPNSQNLITPSSAKLLSLSIAVIAIGQIFYSINASLADSKLVALLGILVALDAALRLVGAGAIGIEPMWFLLILSARVFGKYFGFTMGALAMAVSALASGGVGPWLPFQMFAAAWIGFGAGLMPKLKPQIELAALTFYGVISAEFFGFLMDLQLWPWLLANDTQLSFIPGGAVFENLQRFVVFHFATAMAWDLPRAIITAVLILLAGKSILGALRRAQLKLTLPSRPPVALSQPQLG